jgi:hypothetical protein
MISSHFKIEDTSFPRNESHIENLTIFSQILQMLTEGRVQSLTEYYRNKETVNAAPIAPGKS